MEREKQKENQFESRVRLAHLATMMCGLFSPGHNATQTPEYKQTYEEYMQLQCDMQLEDTQGKKDWHTIG